VGGGEWRGGAVKGGLVSSGGWGGGKRNVPLLFILDYTHRLMYDESKHHPLLLIHAGLLVSIPNP